MHNIGGNNYGCSYACGNSKIRFDRASRVEELAEEHEDGQEGETDEE